MKTVVVVTGFIATFLLFSESAKSEAFTPGLTLGDWMDPPATVLSQRLPGDDFSGGEPYDGNAIIVSCQLDGPNVTVDPIGSTLADPHRWYLLDLEAVFDSVLAESKTPFVGNEGTPTTSLSLSRFQEFYLGYWQAYGFHFDPQPIDYYGWGQFRFDIQGPPGEQVVELELIDSAVSRTGIIVGTYTSAPEPSSLVLLCLGITGLCGFARWRQCRVN